MKFRTTLFGFTVFVLASCSEHVDLLPQPGPIGIAIAPGALVPAFDPAIKSYQVAPDVAHIGLPYTVIPTGTGYAITVNGVAVQSSSVSAPISVALKSPTPIDVAFTSPTGVQSHYSLTIPAEQEAYVKASNTPTTTDGARFGGHAVAIDGDTLVVGAFNEASSGSGINGDQTTGTAQASGAVYVYVRVGTTWQQQAYIKASHPHANDQFGETVAISGDTIVVGAPGESSNATGIGGDELDTSATGAGAAYVFTRTGTTWSQEAYVKAANTRAGAQFGWSTAMGGDTFVVTAQNESSGATGVNGDASDTSAAGAGAAYVFTRTNTQWSQQAYLKASNTRTNATFGYAVGLSADTVVIGSSAESSSSVGVGGNQADTSAPNAGAAYVFTRAGTTWSQQAYLKASNTRTGSYFGYAVTVDQQTIAVGAVQERSNALGIDGNQADTSAAAAGAVYVFSRAGTTWTQQAYVKASNTSADLVFGTSVALRNDTLAVGAPRESSGAIGINGSQTDVSAHYAGAAYLFERAGTSWSQIAYVKASNASAGASYGQALSLSSDTLAVGAYHESSSAVGVNGNETDQSLANSGAVYVLR